ncbi:hypothetical protein V1283_003775 [Bradyrhizobium sp. AZCC 2262]|uniref:hypothetical protein n=1 Tax=Bradyrhizobium sp. AZCC 2262 TaxID=3117022 RepID=UPI002FEF3EC7
MSLEDRLKGYANPQRGPHGAGRDQKNLDYWADRAKANSEIAPRASRTMKLADTGKMDVRSSQMGPKVSRKVEARMAATSDMNVADDDNYMPGVRRDA